jgi:ABC-2 type transport system permease protein
VRAVVIKEFQQLRRDRRTVAMLVVIPLALLLVFGFAASFDVKSIRVGVYGPAAGIVAGRLPERFEVVTTDSAGGAVQAEDLLRRAGATVAIVAGPSPMILVDGADLFGARAAVTAIATQPDLPTPTVLFNPSLETRVIMIPAIIGLILVFVGTVATSLGVVRERQAGTFETLAVMPFRARDIFLGKLAPYFAIAILDMVMVVIAGMLVFGVPLSGSVLTFALGAILFLFVTTGLGVLISLVSQNQGQAIQLAFMTLLPQVLLSGMVFPLEAMPIGVRWISYLLPLTYFTQISRGVMVRGTPIDALLLPFAALTVMAVVVFGVSVLRFRRELAPGTTRHSGRASATEGTPA